MNPIGQSSRSLKGIFLAVAAVIAVTCSACATENGSYAIADRSVIFVPAPEPHDGELARCEATGMSHAQCCDNHNIDPCP